MNILIAYKTNIMKAPSALSEAKLQKMIDSVIFQGHMVVKPKRKYNNQKFAELFAQHGTVVFNKLISVCRQYFIRHLDIPDKEVPRLIDYAVSNTIDEICDRDTDEHDQLYKRVRNWRKNWSRAYIKAAQEVLVELKNKNPEWAGCTKNQLKSLYQTQFTFEYWYHMMASVHAGTIDWRMSLKHTGLNSLYRTVFTWTLV